MKNKYIGLGEPVISIDTKKKEKLGGLYRDGQVYCLEAEKVYDHDYPHLANGGIVPHGIYDLKHNDAMVNIGISADTSEFACDSIKLWWESTGCKRYYNASSLLILADCGGSNSYRHHLFKESLQKLSNSTGLEIRMAHYPPYTSKWNPIEHLLFPHVTRSMSGIILKSVGLVQKLIGSTTTEKGLTVTANVIDTIYEKGRKACPDIYNHGTIVFDKILGALNYKVKPMIS